MIVDAASSAARTNSIHAASGAAPRTPSNDAVKDAADAIESKLDSSGAFQWVDAGEVSDVRDIIVGLDAETANAVIDELETRGLLDKFMSEMVDSSHVGGGVSGDTRRGIFVDLAKKLDGEALAKLHDAVSEQSEGIKGVEWINELSQAIATHSTSQTKVDFVGELANGADSGSWYQTRHTNFGSVITEKFNGDREALAIANVLGSMEDAGSYRDEALSSLSTEQFQAVVEASIYHESSTISAGRSTSFSNDYNAAAFEKLAATVAASNNLSKKAEFMEFGGMALKGVRESSGILTTSPDKDETVQAMLDGMTKVMDSDTAGIVQELATQADNKFGNGLASYAKSMLESGETGERKLAEQLNAIKYGNEGTGDARARLAQENQYRDRPVAAALGYFTGAVWAGAESISNDKQAQADMITSVLVTAVNLHPVSAVTAEGIGHLVNAAVENDKNVGEAMYQSVLPVDANGTISINADIQDTIHTRFSDVTEHANP